jgi:hypothetical protein
MKAMTHHPALGRPSASWLITRAIVFTPRICINILCFQLFEHKIFGEDKQLSPAPFDLALPTSPASW